MTATRPASPLVGSGSTGAALAGALLTARYQVSAWNAAWGKHAPLGEAGAPIAHPLAGAVAASEIVDACLRDYATPDALPRTPDGAARLKGKTVVYLPTGRAEDARNAARRSREHAMAYPDGANRL